jgi:hypothetical protein
MDNDSHLIYEAYLHEAVDPQIEKLALELMELSAGQYYPDLEEAVIRWKHLVDQSTYENLYRQTFGDVKHEGLWDYNSEYNRGWIATDYGDSDEEMMADDFEDALLKQVVKVANNIIMPRYRKFIELGIDGGQGAGPIAVFGLQDLRDEVVSNEGGEFYHVTAIANKDKIDRQGLIPKGARDLSISYTPRIFLFKEIPDDITELGQVFQGAPSISLGGPQSDYTGGLALYKVTVPPGYNIYEDPHSPAEESYYTDKKIPAQNLQFIKEL